MNIYLVTRTDDPSEYDIYMGFVVRASTIKEAVSLCRDATKWNTFDNVWPAADYDYLDTDLIGVAVKDEPEVILADYKAG